VSVVWIFNASRPFSARLVDEMRGSRLQRQAQSRARAGSGNRTADFHLIVVTTRLSSIQLLDRSATSSSLSVSTALITVRPEHDLLPSCRVLTSGVSYPYPTAFCANSHQHCGFWVPSRRRDPVSYLLVGRSQVHPSFLGSLNQCSLRTESTVGAGEPGS
jgi:hypothetical protein